jgi:hypothetical protein
LLLLQQISSENSRRNCTYAIPKLPRSSVWSVAPGHWDLSAFAALGAYHFFLQTGDQHRKTTRSVEYDYGKFIVVAGLASGCTSRDPWPP